MCTFGNFTSAASTLTKSTEKISINLANLFGTQWIDEKVKYMTASMNDGQYVTERIYQLGTEYTRKMLVDEKRTDPNDRISLSHCDELTQDEVKTLGKIFIGGRADQLNQKSCTFIGFDENKLRVVQLDMTRMKPPVQIFPGQICVLGGTNPRGKSFTVSEIHAERILENCAYPLSRLTEPLSFVIASGPYTSDDNLSFEYLDKLIENCQNNKPDVLILTGAFFNAKSQLIFDLATEVDEHFRKMINSISEKLGDGTQIIIVSSHDDINSSACFPTRSYEFKRGLNNANVFLAPDPCILNINGIKIGVTSVDVTKHLADSEFCM